MNGWGKKEIITSPLETGQSLEIFARVYHLLGGAGVGAMALSGVIKAGGRNNRESPCP